MHAAESAAGHMAQPRNIIRENVRQFMLFLVALHIPQDCVSACMPGVVRDECVPDTFDLSTDSATSLSPPTSLSDHLVVSKLSSYPSVPQLTQSVKGIKSGQVLSRGEDQTRLVALPTAIRSLPFICIVFVSAKASSNLGIYSWYRILRRSRKVQ